MATAFEDTEPEDVDPVKEAMSKGDRYMTFIFFERIYSVRRKCSHCGAPGTKCMPFEKRAPTLYLTDEGVVGTQEVQCLKCFNVELCSSSEVFEDIPTDQRLCIQGLEIHYYCLKVTHFELLHDLLELLHVAAIEDTKKRKENHMEFTSFMMQKAKRVCEEWCKPEYTELRYKKFLVLHKETIVGPNYKPKVAVDASDEYKEMYEMMGESFYANRDKICILLELMKESLFDNPSRPFFFMWVGIAMMHTDQYQEFKQQYSIMIGDNPACTALKEKYMSLDIPVGIKKIPVIFVLFELPRFYHYVDFLTRRLGKMKPSNYLKDEEKKALASIEEDTKSNKGTVCFEIPSEVFVTEGIDMEMLLRMSTRGSSEFLPRTIKTNMPSYLENRARLCRQDNPRVISKDDFKEALIEHLKKGSDDPETEVTNPEDLSSSADSRMLVKIESTGYNTEEEMIQYVSSIMNALKLEAIPGTLKDETGYVDISPEVKIDDKAVCVRPTLQTHDELPRLESNSTDTNSQTTSDIVPETKPIDLETTQSVKTSEIMPDVVKSVTHSETIPPKGTETKPVKTGQSKSTKKSSNKSSEKGSVKKPSSTISKPKTSSKKQKSSVKKPKNKWSYKIDEVGDSDTDKEEEFRHLPCKLIQEYVETEKMLESPYDVNDTLQHYLTKNDVSRSVWTIRKKYSHNELMVILDIKDIEVSGMPLVSASNNRGVTVPVLPILPLGNESSALDLTIGCLYGISVPQRLSNKQRNVFQRYVRIAIARARHPELFDMVSLGAIKYVKTNEKSIEVKISVREMQNEARYEEESERRKIIRLLKRASAQAELKNMLEAGELPSGKDTPSSTGKDTPSSTGKDTPSSTGKDTPSSTGKDTPSSTGKDTPSSTGNDTPSSAGKDMPSSTGKDTISSTGKDMPSSTGKDTTSCTGKDMPSGNGKDTTSSSRAVKDMFTTEKNTPSNDVDADDKSAYELLLGYRLPPLQKPPIQNDIPSIQSNTSTQYDEKSGVSSKTNDKTLSIKLDAKEAEYFVKLVGELSDSKKKRWHDFSNKTEVIPEDDSSSISSSDSSTKKSRRKVRDKFQSCVNCNSLITDHRIRICSGCRKVCYCNQHCQKVHWKTHKKICSYALGKEQVTG